MASSSSSGPPAWVVMKFGGSSLQDANCLRHVKKIIESCRHKRIAVVCSAMGKTTNMLLDLMRVAKETGKVDLSALKAYHYSIFDEIVENGDDKNGCEALFGELAGKRVLLGEVLLIMVIGRPQSDCATDNNVIVLVCDEYY